jgi:hypothetical protein
MKVEASAIFPAHLSQLVLKLPTYFCASFCIALIAPTSRSRSRGRRRRAAARDTICKSRSKRLIDSAFTLAAETEGRREISIE